jgi:hypothetical protein
MSRYLKKGATYEAGTPINSGDPSLDDLVNSGGGSSGLTSKTYAELVALIGSGGLTAGTTYKITDRGDLGLLFQAISTTQLNKDGIRLMLCPSYYGIGSHDGNNWIGVWNNTKSVNVDDLTIYSGRVWKNLTGAIGSIISQTNLDATNWQVIEKTDFVNGEYTELQFGVRYDITNDWIERQWDGSNVFGIDYETEQNFWGYGFNLCDICDWNFATSGYPFSNNIGMGVWNNSNVGGIFDNAALQGIHGNYNNGNINGNFVGGELSYNGNNGKIEFNRVGYNLQMNTNGNDISKNTVEYYIANNSNSGKISFNVCETIQSNSSSVIGIYNNIVPRSIEGNSNTGNIYFNTCSGIIGNSNAGEIYQNKNNGQVTTCSGTCNIYNNINNGDISGNYSDDVTDTVVDK